MSTAVARTLRRDSTDAEKRVWRLLRSRQASAKFRRQQPIEGYVVDGGQHSDADEYEQRRMHCLEANGFRILRFWNNDVTENEEGVFDTIVAALSPSPLAGEEGARREATGR